MQIFMFVDFVVIEIRLFNRKKKKMKNMANLNYMYSAQHEESRKCSFSVFGHFLRHGTCY